MAVQFVQRFQAFLTGWEDAVLHLILQEDGRSRRICLALLVAGIVTVTVMLVLTGCPFQHKYANDSIMLLDYGTRLLEGQRPHQDFYSPLGVVPYCMTAFGIWLVGYDGLALGLSYLLIFPLVTLWAWRLAVRRFTSVPAMLIAAMIGLLLIAPQPLGEGFDKTSYAMQYNRLGWSLLSLVILQAAVPPLQAPSQAEGLLEAAGSGMILAVLFFLKFNFFAAAAAILALGWLVVRPRKLQLAAMLAAAAGMSLLILSYLNFNVSGVLADLKMLMAVQDKLTRLQMLVLAAGGNIAELLLMAALLAFLTKAVLETHGDHRKWYRLLMVAIGICCLGLFVTSTNCQKYTIPLFGLAALTLCELFRRQFFTAGDADYSRYSFRFLVTSVVGITLLVQVLGGDLAAVGFAFSKHILRGNRNAVMIDSPRLADMRMAVGDDPSDEQVVQQLSGLEQSPKPALYTTPRRVAVVMNDGLSLVRKHLRPDDKIFVLDGWNMFNFALGLHHAHGDAAWWHYRRVVNEKHCPPPQQVLQEMTLVMEPRASSCDTTPFMRSFYGQAVNEEFVKIDESRLWILYARRTRSEEDGAKHARNALPKASQWPVPK